MSINLTGWVGVWLSHHSTNETPQMSVGKERRRHPRTIVKWPATVLTRQTQAEGQIENVCPVGTFISFTEAPPLEWDLRLMTKPPDHSTISAVAKGDPVIGLHYQ